MRYIKYIILTIAATLIAVLEGFIWLLEDEDMDADKILKVNKLIKADRADKTIMQRTYYISFGRKRLLRIVYADGRVFVAGKPFKRF